MLRAVAETHAVIWYLNDDPRPSSSAGALIADAAVARDQIGVSAITLAEIVYLSEKGRIDSEALDTEFTVLGESASVMWELPLNRTVVAVMASIDRVRPREPTHEHVDGCAYHCHDQL